MIHAPSAPRSIPLLGFILLILITLLPGIPAVEAVPASLPAGVGTDDWQAIQTQIDAHRRQVVAAADGYRAHNPGQDWDLRFTAAGFLVTPGAGDWTWGLAFSGYGGAAAATSPPVSPRLRAEGTRVEYAWDARLTEWFINDERGLEHGFTVQSPPSGAPVGLELILETRGGLQPRAEADGLGVGFVDAAEAVVLRYAGLKVFDATGRTLPARLAVAGRQVTLAVDDREAVYPLTIDPIAQQQYIQPNDLAAGDDFGYAVALDVDTLAVGAPGKNSDAGAVYVFTRSGATWTQQAFLQASDAAGGDKFGSSVALSGDTLAVGAPFRDTGGSDAGAVYVFTRSGTTWTQQPTLTATTPGASANFGTAIALSADTLVVGAPGEDTDGTDAGAVYIFTGGGGSWSTLTRFAAPTANADGDPPNFGAAVALDGNNLAVGAPGDDTYGTDAGAVYPSTRSSGTWSTPNAPITWHFTPSSGSRFGAAVAISGTTLWVGAPLSSLSFSNGGTVFEFTLGQANDYIPNYSVAPNAHFGAAVAISSSIRAGGAPTYSNSNGNGISTGAVALQTFENGVWGADGTTSGPPSFITPSTNPAAAGDNFGWSLAASGGTLAVGAYTNDGKGAVYVFALPNAAPTATSVTIAGAAQVGVQLTGSYTYGDSESDPEGISTFQWYSGTQSDGSDKSNIGGATTDTYTPMSGDIGNYLFFCVTPVAQSGTTTGTETCTATGAGPVDPSILNPTGGTSTTDGLKIWTDKGAYQIQRNGESQIYDEDEYPASLQVILVAENSDACVFDPGQSGLPSSGLTITPWTTNGGTLTTPDADTWVNTETLTCDVNTHTYQVVVTTTYHRSDPYAEVQYEATVPAGSPGPARLYLASDFYLDGSDDGPGVTLLVDGRRLVAQAQYADLSDPNLITAVGGILEAPTEAGVLTAFTSYYEAYYQCPFGDDDSCGSGEPWGPGNSTDGRYPNTVDPDPETDAGVGAHWDLMAAGGTPGTFTVKTQLYFDAQLPGSCGTADGVAVNSAPTTDLCSGGTASIVSGSGPWTWTCIGSTTASCSAPRAGGGGGGGGGPSPVDGVCGSAHGQTLNEAPAGAALCAVGSQRHRPLDLDLRRQRWRNDGHVRRRRGDDHSDPGPDQPDPERHRGQRADTERSLYRQRLRRHGRLPD